MNLPQSLKNHAFKIDSFSADASWIDRCLPELKNSRFVLLDAYRVNRYVKGIGADPDAEAALSGFARFPAWMWRNAREERGVGGRGSRPQES